MSNITFSIDAEKLLRVLPHVSTDKIRPILQGVLCEAGGVLVATDGHTLAAYADAHDSKEDVLLVLSKDAQRLANKAAKAGECITVEAAPFAEGQTYAMASVSWQRQVLPVERLGWPYPDWRQAMPKGEPQPTHHIPIMSGLGQKFGCEVRLWFYAPKTEAGLPQPIYVETPNPDFFGLWMPTGGAGTQLPPADSQPLVPAWARQRPDLEEKREVVV